MTLEKRAPAPRVHLHAYERLRTICVEIQRGRYPTRDDLARLVERHPRTIQRDLRALRDDHHAPLVFDRKRNGFRFSDPAWQMPEIKITEGELIGFFAAEQLLRRLGASAETSIARAALRSGDGVEVAIPAYESLSSDEQLGERMLQVLMHGVSTRGYQAVLPQMAQAVGGVPRPR